ncbi:COG4705 family protein [Phaeacidiphilus oryzae]|uniref:COG4705 family protein n=1 Tax=Phaeacidiphilus oryzae TaxID=348818 RepID=UPI0009FB9E16|nr:hypothetical protein [Phaeacidiphilus oryzae]
MTIGQVRQETEAPGHPRHRGTRAAGGAVKVPEVTPAFWVTKVLTTGMGEVLSDYLNHVLNPFVAVGLGFLAFVAALAVQFRSRRYRAVTYWFAVVMVSVFGTMAADVLHVVLGVPYQVSTPFFAVALAVVLGLWRWTEGTLSIHSVVSGRREVWYWLTVLCTFALGTAAGDLTAYTLGLGYLASAVLFAVVIVVPALGYGVFRLNAVFAFWFAYVVTRPLGASLADWMAVSKARGGLAFGLGATTAAWTVAIVAFVGYLAMSRRRETA